MSWSPPRIATRTGAAHLRRGISCQDTSGWVRLDAAAAGQPAEAGPVWAMAVADGHGNARHRRSREGSRIACELALELSVEPFAHGEGAAWEEATDPAAMARVLERDLAAVIVGRWREQVRRHWREHREAGAGGIAAERFSPLLYGSTLGLVLLTPRWWAHTGLGDWDLVRVDADGQARLLSQEHDPGGAASTTAATEATASLCLTDAARCFAGRTRVHALAPDAPPFALLLSTDGIRKSCGSDADFLTLAAYLAAFQEPAPGQLDADLDRISGEGSGDDVSVAIARWGMAGGDPVAPEEPGGGWIEKRGRRMFFCQPAALPAAKPLPAAEPPAAELLPLAEPLERSGGRRRWLASLAFLLLLALIYAASAWLRHLQCRNLHCSGSDAHHAQPQ